MQIDPIIHAREFGVDNIKGMLSFVFTAVAKGLNIDSNSDGQLTFPEIFSVVTTLSFRFPEVQRAFPFLKKEFKDLDETEIEELRAFVNNELELPIKYDHLEEAIRRTVNMLHYNYRYVRDVIELFDDPILDARLNNK